MPSFVLYAKLKEQIKQQLEEATPENAAYTLQWLKSVRSLDKSKYGGYSLVGDFLPKSEVVVEYRHLVGLYLSKWRCEAIKKQATPESGEGLFGQQIPVLAGDDFYVLFEVVDDAENPLRVKQSLFAQKNWAKQFWDTLTIWFQEKSLELEAAKARQSLDERRQELKTKIAQLEIQLTEAKAELAKIEPKGHRAAARFMQI